MCETRYNRNNRKKKKIVNLFCRNSLFLGLEHPILPKKGLRFAIPEKTRLPEVKDTTKHRNNHHFFCIVFRWELLKMDI